MISALLSVTEQLNSLYYQFVVLLLRLETLCSYAAINLLCKEPSLNNLNLNFKDMREFHIKMSKNN